MSGQTALVPLDKTASSVVTVLENARSWLATAVEMTGPEEIAAAKAHIKTAETFARELHLSKEIQMDAVEMVRRAEYALGKSIRKGQSEGKVRVHGQVAHRANQHGPIGEAVDNGLSSPTDFAKAHELSPGNGQAGIYALVDDVEPEQFEEALAEAKSEGNLSRANVVRKVKQQASPQTRDLRADMIQHLANEGYSSRQMPSRVGVTEESVRQIARDYGIEIPADKTINRTRRHDSARIARETVQALEGLAIGVGLMDYADLEAEEARNWATSLNDSLRVLNRFSKQIKEMTQ